MSALFLTWSMVNQEQDNRSACSQKGKEWKSPSWACILAFLKGCWAYNCEDSNTGNVKWKLIKPFFCFEGTPLSIVHSPFALVFFIVFFGYIWDRHLETGLSWEMICLLSTDSTHRLLGPHRSSQSSTLISFSSCFLKYFDYLVD